MTYPTMEMYEALHAEKAELRAEVEQLTEQLHYANGTCDLAMKHRDEAEAEIEQQRQLLRAARGLLQHHNILYPDEIDDAIPRWPDSEIALLRAEVKRLTTVHDDYVVAANANVCALYRDIDRLKADKIKLAEEMDSVRQIVDGYMRAAQERRRIYLKESKP